MKLTHYDINPGTGESGVFISIAMPVPEAVNKPRPSASMNTKAR